ncbi:MAG: glycoside hydrolase family 43 protein [Oscillospiraceae bacterium]|nr:glycoside hydrolase family 43 protein [Oscillospiraceae bacterium]
MFQNPIIPGFHPDPSICRVGEDYFLAASSFEFFPGVPIFHSRDLQNWEQIGHALTRKSQLNLNGCQASGGIFAPTLRYNNGRFFMITTNVTHGGNFYVYTDDIYGEWSDPVWVNQEGIDPSLFFDSNGAVYYTSTHTDEKGKPCIASCIIDIDTGKMLSEIKPIWHGTGGKWPEGPHLYHINNFYYLMNAEGGTEYGHMETIARSKTPWGPFEPCPHNPILTHRDYGMQDTAFHGLGHADLVDAANGKWYMVFHAIRPSQFMLHHIGRETMIAEVTWSEGWPLVGGIDEPVIYGDLDPWKPFIHVNFDCNSLPIQFSFLRNPYEKNYSLLAKPGYLMLKGTNDTLDDLSSPTFVGVRQQHFDVQLDVTIDFWPEKDGQEAGVTVFHTNEHHYEIVLTLRDGERIVFLRRRAADMQIESNPLALPGETPVILRIEANRLIYTFFAGTEKEKLKKIGAGSSQLLSTECTNCTFTGCFLSLYAQKGAKAFFRDFSYKFK